MPSLSVRLEREAPGTRIVVLDALTSDEVQETVRDFGLPDLESSLGVSRGEWDAEGMEAAGGGPLTPSLCPWFGPRVGLEWSRRLRDGLAGRLVSPSATWPWREAALADLDEIDLLLRRAEAEGLRWNLIAF